MKINLFILIFLVAFLPSSYGQVVSAKDIVEKVREHYNPNYAFKAKFNLEIDYPENEAVNTNGTLYLKGDKFRFVTDNEEYISNSLNLWVWTKTNGINEVQISYVEDNDGILSMSDVFNVYLKGFAYKLISQTTKDNHNVALIELIPAQRDDNNPYFKVKSIINTEENELDQLQVFFKDGSVYTFSIKNEEPTVLVDAHFEFDESEHAEVEVIDLR